MTAEPEAAEPSYAPAQAYDLAAPYYDAWRWQTFWREVELPVIVAAVEAWAAAHGAPRLADIGCGTGWYLKALEADCASQAGVDVSVEMLARARTRLPRATLLEADIRRLPFADEAFDIVVSTRVLSHVAELARALGELTRIVAPEGRLILTNVDAAHDYDHTRLPLAERHISVDTYKHPRARIGEMLAATPLRHVRSALISPEGETAAISILGAATSAPVVGWISEWRRE